jgi:demethylmenaquinone methyltransferase/2-methoxy-6-polyprenyl-1,4-benzoquinol methylase
MANKYYKTGEQRAARVHDLFATVASRYDLINDLQSLGLHRWWKSHLIRLAQTRPRHKALDVCCGTGDIALGLARAGAEVVGLDFSEAMLAVARSRNPALRVEWLQGDALRLPFADDTFDRVTIGYGLRNLGDIPAALDGFLRVLHPGGRLLVLDFGKPENRLWRALYYGYLRRVVPVFGRIFCGDTQTHAYILESLRHYPGQRGVAKLLAGLGAEDIQTHDLLGGAMSITVAQKPRGS